MSKKCTRVIAVLLFVFVMGSLVIGCQKTQNEPSQASQESNSATSVNTEKQETPAKVYPIKTDKTLTFWTPLNVNVSPTTSNYGDTPFAKELEKRTGVKIEYIHPPEGADQQKQAFNLLLASNDLPDMIEYDWLNGYPGGPENAIANGAIVKLNDVIDRYSPNLKKYLDENPQVQKMVKTDSGSTYNFPFIRGDDLLLVYFGPVMRKDWLDNLSLGVPTTIDEWYNVLKEFKEKKGASAALTFLNWMKGVGSGVLSGPFGITESFYIDDGKVKYGPAEPGWKDYLSTLNKWYSEGLLDQNFATIDGKGVDNQILTGKTGATLGFPGSGLGKWIPAGKEVNPEFNLIPVPYPTLKKGEKPKFGQRDNPFVPAQSVAISSGCKDIELAAKWLDYGYGEEGHMLFNFGVEGEAYELVNGEAKYTDLIMKNPDGLPVSQAMGKYFQASFGGPFVQDKGYITQYYAFDEQKQALSLWSDTDAVKHILPPLTSTPDESKDEASIINEVNTYAEEMYFKFVMGQESLDNFDKYVNQLKQVGIEKVISMKQNSLERFNSR